MKREIKFRAWDGKRIIYLSDLSIGLKSRTKKICPYAYFATNTFNGQISILKHQIMQYTGLSDKNDNEIYEGDIVTIYDPYTKSILVTEIIWDDPNCRFAMKNTFVDFDFLIQDEIEVIGNIYQNPELLK
jgi:hypothetical protein